MTKRSIRTDKLRHDTTSTIREYAHLKPGWDGYDGVAFTKDVIDRAVRVVADIAQGFARADTHVDELVACPCSDGRIDVEANRGVRSLIVTVDPAKITVDIYYVDDGPESHEDISPELVVQWAQRLANGGPLQKYSVLK